MGLWDSPLERGAGVCPMYYYTPLQPHSQSRPLSRGELLADKINPLIRYFKLIASCRYLIIRAVLY
jgi:hypothetical protein